MKKHLVLIPLIVVTAVSGCSTRDQAFNQSQSFPIVITDQLTPEEVSGLQTSKHEAHVKDRVIRFTSPVVTESSGSKKNGPYTQGQHVRFILDTSELPPDCRNDATAPEVSPCVQHITITSTEDNDEQNRRAESAVLHPNSPRGVHAIEFDAIDASQLRALVMLDGGNYVTFDLRTGKTIKSGVMESTP